MIDPAHFVDHLREQGVTMYTGVPDSLLKQLGSHIMATLPRENHVIAANEGAKVSIVAHETLEPLVASAEFAADTFNVSLKPVAGHTDALKAKILRTSDVIFRRHESNGQP